MDEGGDGSRGLGLSLRQTRRLLALRRKKGAAALAHGGRGRSPYNKLGDALGARAAELAVSIYEGLDTLSVHKLCEILAERMLSGPDGGRIGRED